MTSTMRQVAQDAVTELQSANIKLTSVVPVPLGFTTRDLDYAYGALANSDARYILLFARAEDTGQIYFRAKNSTLFSSRNVWISYNLPWAYTGDQRDVFGPNFEDQLDSMIVPVPFVWTYHERTFKFKERWKNLSLERPDLYPWDTYFDDAPYSALIAYDCVQVLARGYDQFLRKNAQIQPEALSNGSLKDIFDYRQFANTSYEGISIDVAKLNHYGEQYMPFLWYNLNKTMYWSYWVFPNDGFVFTEFDSFQITGLAPLFPGNVTIPPSDGSRNASYTSQEIVLESSEGRLLIAFEVIGLTCSIFFTIVTIKFRHEKIIRSAAPPFLIFLIMGTMLRLYIGPQTTSGCQAQTFLTLTAFAMIFGALIVKNYRIHLLFSRRKLSTSKMAKLEYMMAVYAAIVIIEEILLIIWVTLLKPSGVYFENAKTLTYGTICQIQSTGSSRANAITGVLYAYNILLLLLTLYVSYLVRKVSESYRESILLLIIVLATSIMVGFVFSTSTTSLDQIRSTRFAQAAAVWGVTVFSLILIFGAKVLGLWMERFSLSRTSKKDWTKIFKNTAARGASTLKMGKSEAAIDAGGADNETFYYFREL
ncbi:hypothetical protein HDV05_008485, partial [Chytridiales sp. JEL 0842]